MSEQLEGHFLFDGEPVAVSQVLGDVVFSWDATDESGCGVLDGLEFSE